MDEEKWIVGEPGGPAGPFWSLVSSSGRVIAMQIPDGEYARFIAGLHKRVNQLEHVLILIAGYEAVPAVTKQNLIELAKKGLKNENVVLAENGEERQ